MNIPAFSVGIFLLYVKIYPIFVSSKSKIIMDIKDVKKPNIRPLADRVLIKPIPTEEFKTASGLIIPESAAKESATQGVVVRVSKQVEQASNDWEQLNEGDLVMFSEFAGSDIKQGTVTYKMMRFTDVFGVVEQ